MDNTSRQKLHELLVNENLYSKSYDEFKNQFSNPESQKKLHGLLINKGLYSKSDSEFNKQFFSDLGSSTEKKNPIQNQKLDIKPATVSPSASKTTKPSLGLGQQVITGPSASFSAAPTKAPVQPKAAPAPQQNVSVTPTMQSQGQLLMAQPKPKTAEDFIQIEKQKRDVTSPTFVAQQAIKPQQPKPKVGALEDIGNTFKSSMASLTSGIAGLPNMANRLAFMMLTKTLGLDEEYNALPVQKKKELDSAISKMVSGVSVSPTVQTGNISPELSRETQEFFIKKSNEFNEKTNKQDKYLNERIGDFYKNPSVDKAADLAIEVPKLFAGSLPYMINPALGAISSASQTYAEDLKESQGKLGWGQILNAGVTGVTEYYIEKITNGVLNRSVADAVGVKRAAADFAKGFIKSVLKDVGLESGGELVTQLTQSLSDDITNGREIDWVKTANQAIDASIGGFGMAASMRATGAGLGYLAKKVMPKSDKDIIDRNTRAIMDLNTKKGPDNSPEVNSVIDSKINELNKANLDIINNSVNTVKSLSDDQLKEIVRIDKDMNDILAKREPIAQDPNLSDEEKQSLLDHLKSQYETLKQQKDAIQKQTTSEVPVQPEAGTGLQVAEGEPQAKPQGTSQEGQGQEVETITADIPKQDLPKVMDLVSKIEKGEQPSSPEDLQIQQNYPKQVEELLTVRAKDMGTMPEVTVDVTTPVKFEEGKMPEISADQIDWEASKMGNIYDAIDSFGGINDITVVDVKGKNAKGQYEGKVRVTGQDTSREGVVVFKDPNAPFKPRMARQRKVSTDFANAEKLLSDNGVYPSAKNVEAIAELSKSKPGAVTAEDIQGVVKVYNKKAKAIADAFNKDFEAKLIEGIGAKENRPDVENMEGAINDITENISPAKYTKEENKRLDEIENTIAEDEYVKDSKNLRGVKYSDIFIGNKSLTDILDKSKLSIPEKTQIKDIFKRGVTYFKFNKSDEQNFLEGAANPEDAQDIYDALSMMPVVEQSNFNAHNTSNYDNVKTEINYIVSNPDKYSKGVVDTVWDIKEKLDNPRSSMDRLYAIDVMGGLGLDLKTQEEGLSEKEIDKLYEEADKIHKAASERGKKDRNENIQSKAARTKVATEEIEEGSQPEPGAAEQTTQNLKKREQIKKSLEQLKDAGILRSAITGRKDISQGEIDAQMALTDAMANVWRETTGRDDFYENFFNDVSEGDIDAILEKGGVLFQNIELPQRPLTRVSLAVFDLPEFKKMEGKEVAINSIKDLARTRGKQIEKDLMMSTLEFDKYKDAKKISFDEFRADVEMQIMKLEKIVTSSYADYGADNLGDSDVYGYANTIIYNSPVDHGEYGHFRGDFRQSAISSGTMIDGANMDWNDWEIRQIPGTDKYAAVDKSMPDNVTQDQLSNYIGTAGTKEQVEKWIEDRKNYEGDINVGLFGHTRTWYAAKDKTYYLAELQSDYFQKNDPNDLYAKQVKDTDAINYANDKYNENDLVNDVDRIEKELSEDGSIKIEKVPGKLNLYLKQDGDFVKVLSESHVEHSKELTAQIKYNLLRRFNNIINGRDSFPDEYKNVWEKVVAYNLAAKSWRTFEGYKIESLNKRREYQQEYIKNEVEKIKNSEKGVSMLKQFAASQKVHELRLLRESLRNAAQEGAETLRFPTPYTLAVIEGYVNKAGENGAPYTIVSGDSDRLDQGDIIDYGGIEMIVVDSNAYDITVAPRDEVFVTDYYDFINNETINYTDEVIGEIKRSVNDVNNITESDLESIEFGDLPWTAGKTEDVLRAAIEQSEDGSIRLSDVEDNISDEIRDYLYGTPIDELFWGDETYSDGDQTYYLVERRGSIETFKQPDEYEEGSAKEDFESQISRDQQTVVNKYKELNKILKKMRPDAEVVTDDNGMEWLETKLTPEDANNPLIAFQEEGGNIKGAVDFSNDNKASVYMFNGADISTLAHEMSGHLGRRFLEQLANVDEDFASDYEKAKEWAGVKDNQWSTAAEEKWSRGFERYLRDGKAPTKELKSVFQNLREWLKNIYKYIKGSNIDIELTPEITRVFDNLLGARSEDTGIKELPGYDRMMGEVKGIVDKSFKRGVSYMQTMDNAIKYMEKSRVYEDATDIQREAMVREVRKMFKQKEKKAPTAQKILGQAPTKTTITVDESKELAKKLKALEAAEQTGRKIGYKEGLKESEQARKDILDYVKSLKVNNKISGVQFKAIVNALKANLLNPVIRKRVEERIDKIIKKANYADQLDRSNKLRTAIKKASKSKTLAANIAAMAKKFAKVNPNNLENLDEYIDMANLVYDSIGKPIRTIAEEAMVNEYSDTKIKEAQEAKSAGLEELFNSLVEQGLIPKNLSLAEIQQYILDEEQNKKAEESEQREKEKRDVLGKVFDALKDISNIILNEGYNPFTGEDVTLTAEDRQLLKDFTSMDLNKLPIASAYRAQEALMNYIVNGKKFGMIGILNRYQGAENAKIAVEKGLKAADFRWAVGGSWWGSRKWAKEVESIPGLFTWLFRGRTRGREMMKLMGLDEFMAGAAEAKIDRVNAENEYIAKFLKKKPNGKRFNNINNTYERLVYAYLSRSVDGSQEEKQAEFDRRKRILTQNVQAMEQSRNKELIEEAQVLKRELNKAKDAKNADELKSKFDPINIQAVEFISGKFDEYFDKVDEVAEGVYNLILSKDDLYTPDMFRDISEKEINVAEMKESVDIPFDLLNKQPAGTMLENKRIANLPGYDVKNKDASKVTKILKLDFDSSAFNALEKSLTDTYTAAAVQKYSAFTKSDDFSKLFDNVKDEKLFKELVNYYINNERGKIGYKSDWKAVQNFSTRLKNLSTYRALGSATAFLKQSASAIVNTAANLSNDPYALSQVTKAMLKDPAIGDFINRSKSEINLRGAEATADIKSAEKLIRESKYQGLNDALDVLDKTGRLQMKSLSLGDVPMARASWFGYYVHALKMQGKPYKNIDWSKAKLDKDAAFYANTEVSINQNASMPSTLGQLFSSKNPLTRLTATYLFPFTSFLFNAKSRMKTDITVLTSKLATAEDKQAAGRSLVATLAEMPTYIAISTAINYALVGAANAFLGYDEDEEDEKLRLKRYGELALTRIITDLLSPLPNIGDVSTVAAFNAILEKVQEDPEMEEEEKKDIIKLFESKPDNMAQAMAELLLQPIASTGRRVADIYTTIDMATGDYYINDKGKEIEFTAEEKRMLQIAAAMQIMGSLNLLPSEGESLAKKIVKAVEKKNKEEGNY